MSRRARRPCTSPSDRGFSASKPRPSASTMRWSALSRRSRSTLTVRASACRALFVRASWTIRYTATSTGPESRWPSSPVACRSTAIPRLPARSFTRGAGAGLVEVSGLPDLGQPQRERGERLARLVVELPGDAPALLLLRRDHLIDEPGADLPPAPQLGLHPTEPLRHHGAARAEAAG